MSIIFTFMLERWSHSQKKSKGVSVLHDTPIQIMLNKHSTYQHMVERCRTAVYPEAEAGSAQYYVSNSTGACI